MIVKILVHCMSLKELHVSYTCNRLFILWLFDVHDLCSVAWFVFSLYNFILRNVLSLKQCSMSWLCFCFVEFVLNPTGKSYVCILHEYAQHTLRVQPRYVFKELGKIKHANSLNLCMYIFCIYMYTTTIFSS